MGRQGGFGVAAEQVGGGEREDGPQALAPAQLGIAHGLVLARGAGGGGRDEPVEALLDAVAIGLEEGGEFHGEDATFPR